MVPLPLKSPTDSFFVGKTALLSLVQVFSNCTLFNVVVILKNSLSRFTGKNLPANK